MIYGLSKDEIARLPDEQKELIARIALDQARRERRIREEAEGYSGYRLVPIILLIVATLLATSRLAGNLSFYVIGLAGLIQFHAIGINKRIDALLKLMDRREEDQVRQQEESGSLPEGGQKDNPV